ncbi:hypothetical protein AB6A40_007760 [Gnathostoma spinigerum]|uniref:Uncharacterized protein n=1 Tax=Gnathostoma spinigerum TaxID=75299 RepID=A0ABD6EMN5_9BILA
MRVELTRLQEISNNRPLLDASFPLMQFLTEWDFSSAPNTTELNNNDYTAVWQFIIATVNEMKRQSALFEELKEEKLRDFFEYDPLSVQQKLIKALVKQISTHMITHR